MPVLLPVETVERYPPALKKFRAASALAKVTVVARSVDALETVASSIGGNAVVSDLSDDLAVDGLIEHIESKISLTQRERERERKLVHIGSVVEFILVERF